MQPLNKGKCQYKCIVYTVYNTADLTKVVIALVEMIKSIRRFLPETFQK